ncbi:MAG: cell division topological specificity factor MinE [Clostridia bacterium]|nr:cell division topological specificity factor MinE [Clostridia bacterium]
MNTIAEIGEARLQSVLLKDKKQDPKHILNMLRSDIYSLLENYMEVVRLDADIEFSGGFFEFRLTAHARQIKPIGTLHQ